LRYAKIWIVLVSVVLTAPLCVLAQDPGWPRQLTNSGGQVLIYQPQVDDWRNFTDIKWCSAFQMTVAVDSAGSGHLRWPKKADFLSGKNEDWKGKNT